MSNKRAVLNVHLCFDTEIGRQYIEQQFTALALLFGNPEPLEKFHVPTFLDCFEQVFGVRPTWTEYAREPRDDEAMQWIKHYYHWYMESNNVEASRRRKIPW